MSSNFYRRRAGGASHNTSFLQSTLNRLVAPGDTAGNLLHDIFSGEGVSGKTFSPINPWTNQDYRVSPRKVGESVGISNPTAASAFGLGTQIFLDPTTYLGIGAMSKTGKASALADAAVNIAKINRAMKGTRGRLGGIIGKQAITKTPRPLYKSTMEAQAKAGQRNLLTFAGKPILPRSIEESVFSFFTGTKRGLLGERTLTGIPAFDTKVAKVSNTLRKAFIPQTRLRPLGMSEEDFAILQRVAVTAKSRASAGENLAVEIGEAFNKEISALAKSLKKSPTGGTTKAVGQLEEELKKELTEALQAEVRRSISKEVLPEASVRKEQSGVFNRMKSIFKESTETKKKFGKTVVDHFYLPLVHKDSLLGKWMAKTAPRIGKSKIFSTATGHDIQSQWRVVDSPEGKFVAIFKSGVSYNEASPGKVKHLSFSVICS